MLKVLVTYLNLYLSGFPESSGAGKPPQYDMNDSIYSKESKVWCQ